ncbi:MAG: hypothetical protein JNL70_26710 [Saprospiraceae bacterium]|nr:hypothetical protein [Saprospiraceae bacterium]
MEYLSEDTIKRAALAFMKTYYKFRPRNGETVIQYDRAHASGVVVDGHLTFPKEDGSPFVATFEATSLSSAAEVLFRLQKKQLQWDAIAIGAVVTSVIVFCLWILGLWSVGGENWVFSVILVPMLFVLSFLGFQMINRTSGRYRYIYAIEQFKQYHADEQWIALGHDVFPDPLDANFNELKLQCVKNGFGLMTIDKNEYVNLLITPAREEVFGNKRKALKFEESAFANSGLQRLNSASLERFARPFLNQILVTSIALLALGGLSYRSWQLRPVITVTNSKVYRDSMAALALQMENKKEDERYLLQKNDVIKPDPNPQTYDAATVSIPTEQNNVGLYVFTIPDGYISYECERMDMHGTKYVVQDLTFANFSDAKRRIEHLKTYGLITNAISLGCTTSSSPKQGYCVYYEVIFNEEKAANSKALQIKKELERLQLNHDFIKIRVLNFQNF